MFLDAWTGHKEPLVPDGGTDIISVVLTLLMARKYIHIQDTTDLWSLETNQELLIASMLVLCVLELFSFSALLSGGRNCERVSSGLVELCQNSLSDHAHYLPLIWSINLRPNLSNHKYIKEGSG